MKITLLREPIQDRDQATHLARPSLRDLFRYFLWLGTTGFGGPIALVGYMEAEFVGRRRWATEQELKDGLAFSQLAPGPLAAQLALYLGWLCAGIRGATVAGIGFIVPSFLMVLILAVLYVRLGGISWLQGAFYGVGAAVIAIIARSAVKLARFVLQRDPLLWTLSAVSAVATAWTESEVVWIFLLGGAVAMIVRAPPRLSGQGAASLWLLPIPIVPLPSWWLSGLHGPASAALLGTLFAYFGAAGLFVFGSGLAIVPFLHGGVVLEHRWLTERQFLDAVAVALITPGPVVITVAFIGYLVAGPLGASAAAAGVFAPVYFLTILLAPRYEQLKRSRRVRAFVDGVTASVTGAIAGAAFVLGRRAVFDVPTALIAIAALLLLLTARKLPEPLVIVAAGIAGVVAH